MMEGNHVVVDLTVQQIPGGKETMGWHSWYVAVEEHAFQLVYV